MMLTASYVLMTLGGRLEQVRSGMTYVVISLVASVLFLVGLAFTYAATGTVNMADLAEHIPELPSGVRAALAGLLLVVFGIKAALFPLYFWLPDSYPTAPSAVTAIFAGLLTKVGVYAIIRTQTLLFPPDSRPATLILIIAGATMVVGALGAIAQEDIRRVFSFYIISQIGYIIMGLGLFTVAGLAAAVYAIVHHIVVKTSLFLVGGLIEHADGSSRLRRLGDMVRTAPVIAVLYLLPALSLAGIPPFSGFPAKLGLFDATARSSQWAILAVGVTVSLLTLFSLFKVWIAVFWRPRRRRRHEPSRRLRCRHPPPAGAAADARPDRWAGRADARHRRGRRTAVRLQRPGSGRSARPHALPRGGAAAMRSATIAAGLAVIWVLLWGSASPANILGGLAAGGRAHPRRARSAPARSRRHG